MSDQLPYFFFSYARSDTTDGPHLGRFYTDLHQEIRGLTGHPPTTELGFFDTRSIHIGTTWSDELVHALAHSRTFLALCSPSYVNSEYCGREWGAFADRARHYSVATGRRSAKLIPLMWIPVTNPPAVMAEVQYDHLELGELYSKHGIRYLLRLKRNEDDYQEFLAALARRIVTMAHDDLLPPAANALPFEKAPDVFVTRASLADLAGGAASRPGPSAADPAVRVEPAHWSAAVGDARPAEDEPPGGPASASAQPPARPSAEPNPRARTVGGGPRVVTFVIAATGADELPDIRRHRIYYGPHFQDWAPYQPHHSHGVCSTLQEVAGKQNMISTVAQLEPGVGALLDRARERNEIVLFIIDIWTARMERFREPFAEYDRSNEPTTGVLVPWDVADHETNERREELVRSLRAVLERTLLRQDELVQVEIPSYESLRAVLSRALARLQAKIIETSEPFRDANGPRRPPPTIQGP